NDILEFYVRATAGKATLKRIELKFTGRRHEITAKHNAISVDGKRIHGKKINVPNDGAWHRVNVDLKKLSPKVSGALTGITLEADNRRSLVVDDIVLRSR